MFKTGDRVKLIENYVDLKKGSIGTVINDTKAGCCRVCYDNKSQYIDGDGATFTFSYRLKKISSHPNTNVFK